MTKEELVQAARVFHRIGRIKSYVSKERFVMVANTRFGIDDERKLDFMYGLLNMTPQLITYIAIADNEAAQKSYRIPKYVKLIPQAIEIAESAYELLPDSWEAGHVPTVEQERYRANDKRRYFYIEDGHTKTIDISMGSREDIILLSELLQRDGIYLKGVAIWAIWRAMLMATLAKDSLTLMAIYIFCIPTQPIVCFTTGTAVATRQACTWPPAKAGANCSTPLAVVTLISRAR